LLRAMLRGGICTMPGSGQPQMTR